MTTILSPVTCHGCRATVHVVRRTVEVPCQCEALGIRLYGVFDVCHHSPHVIPDAAWTVVDADGEQHRCPEVAAA